MTRRDATKYHVLHPTQHTKYTNYPTTPAHPPTMSLTINLSISTQTSTHPRNPHSSPQHLTYQEQVHLHVPAQYGNIQNAHRLMITTIRDQSWPTCPAIAARTSLFTALAHFHRTTAYHSEVYVRHIHNHVHTRREKTIGFTLLNLHLREIGTVSFLLYDSVIVFHFPEHCRPPFTTIQSRLKQKLLPIQPVYSEPWEPHPQPSPAQTPSRLRHRWYLQVQQKASRKSSKTNE